MLMTDILDELVILRDRQDNIDMRAMSIAGVDPKKVEYYREIILEREKKEAERTAEELDIDFNKIQQIATQKAIEYKNMFHKQGQINGS